LFSRYTIPSLFCKMTTMKQWSITRRKLQIEQPKNLRALMSVLNSLGFHFTQGEIDTLKTIYLHTDAVGVVLDYTKPELMRSQRLTPTEKTLLVIDGIEIETTATVLPMKGDDRPRLIRKPSTVKIPDANY